MYMLGYRALCARTIIRLRIASPLLTLRQCRQIQFELLDVIEPDNPEVREVTRRIAQQFVAMFGPFSGARGTS